MSAYKSIFPDVFKDKLMCKKCPFSFRWILDMQCGGSRNFLQAFKMAVENDEEIKHGIRK